MFFFTIFTDHLTFHTRCVGFFPSKQFFNSPDANLVSCDSVLTLPGVSIPQIEGSISQTVSTSGALSPWLSVTHNSDWTAINQGSPDPLLGSVICINTSKNSGRHLCLPVYYIIKDMIKDTYEHLKVENILRLGLKRAK